MMVEKNRKTKGFGGVEKEYFFKGFAFGVKKDNFLCTDVGFGCDCKDGTLKNGLRLKTYLTRGGLQIKQTMNRDLKKIVFFTTKNSKGNVVDRVALIGDANEYFFLFDDEFSVPMFSSYNSEKGFSCELLWSEEDGTETYYIVSNEGLKKVQGRAERKGIVYFNKTRGGCICKERIFLAKENGELWYSMPLDPTDYEETVDDSGRIQLVPDGEKLIDLCAFGEYIYAFFERKILRITAAGAARDFKVERVAYDGSQVIKGSVTVGGKCVFFLTETGVYSLAGKRAEKMDALKIVKPLGENAFCSSAYVAGKYLLTYQTDAAGTYQTVVIDEKGEDWYYTSLMKGLTNYKGKAYAYVYHQLLEINPAGDIYPEQSGVFYVRNLRFGNGRVGLKRLRFEGVGSFSLTLKVDGKERTYDLECADGEAVAEVGLAGSSFALSFALREDCELKNMTASVEALKGA